MLHQSQTPPPIVPPRLGTAHGCGAPMPEPHPVETRPVVDPAPRACRIAREIVSAFLDVPMPQIERPTRAQAPACEARHVAIYLAHVVMQISLTDVARCFGRDRTSVAHAVRRMEDRRDDGGFDALLSRLERLAAALWAERGEGR